MVPGDHDGAVEGEVLKTHHLNVNEQLPQEEATTSDGAAEKRKRERQGWVEIRFEGRPVKGISSSLLRVAGIIAGLTGG